jgi:putative membrane protein insertion efficiency factor
MSILAKALLALVRGYQLLFSSFMGRSCRYYPTCSSYMTETVRRFGALRGGFMGLCRILRCHPFHDGGYDPVPEQYENPLRAIKNYKKPCGCAAKYDKHAPNSVQKE